MQGDRWPVAAGQYYWVAQLAPCRYAKPLSFLSGWKLMSSWQVFLAAGVMIVGNGVAAVVVFLHGSSPFWLPTVLGIITTILIFVVNRWCPHLLAKAEFPMLIFHLIVFALFMAILLGLRKFSGLPYATPGDVFFTFRNGGGWASIGAGAPLIWNRLRHTSGPSGLADAVTDCSFACMLRVAISRPMAAHVWAVCLHLAAAA